MTPEPAPDQGTTWQTGEPAERGAYVLLLQRDKYSTPRAEIWCWDGEVWHDCGCEYDEDLDGKVVGWTAMPEAKVED